MFFMFDANADEWADKDCKEYEELIGGLVGYLVKRLICQTKQEKPTKKKKQRNYLMLVLP